MIALARIGSSHEEKDRGEIEMNNLIYEVILIINFIIGILLITHHLVFKP